MCARSSTRTVTSSSPCATRSSSTTSSSATRSSKSSPPHPSNPTHSPTHRGATPKCASFDGHSFRQTTHLLVWWSLEVVVEALSVEEQVVGGLHDAADDQRPTERGLGEQHAGEQRRRRRGE